MKPATLKQLQKNFDKRDSYIYLAGPFFNKIQRNHAQGLAEILKGRGYHIYAPVSEQFVEQALPESALRIFERNIRWMEESSLILAQLDYPLDPPNVLSILNLEKQQHSPISLPDAGTVFEMGFAYAMSIPIIGYFFEPVLKANLMLTESMIGYIDECPLDIFLKDGIMWPLIIPEWKGKKT